MLKKDNLIRLKFFSGISCSVYMPSKTLYILAKRLLSTPRIYKRLVGYSTVYHSKTLHNYFIPCYRKHSGQQGTMGRLGGLLTNIQRLSCILIGCIFLWHGIKRCITQRIMYRTYVITTEATASLS